MHFVTCDILSSVDFDRISVVAAFPMTRIVSRRSAVVIEALERSSNAHSNGDGDLQRTLDMEETIVGSMSRG